MKYKLSDYLSDNAGSITGITLILVIMSIITINAARSSGYASDYSEYYIVATLTGIYVVMFTVDYFRQRKLFKNDK